MGLEAWTGLRHAIGPVCIGLAVWCAAGRISLAASDSASIRLAIAAPWWVAAIAPAAAALVPAWRRSPLLALPALLGVLPWLPVPLPAVALVWTGPLAWVPIGLCVIAAVVATGAAAPVVGRPLKEGIAAGLVRDPRYQPRIAAGATLVVALVAAWVLNPRLPAGDEPHYLVITQSLIKDADLRIENNHRARDYAAYLDAPLAPDFLRRGRDGQIYSIHAPGLPVLVLPAFWLFGYRGAQAAVLILAALAGGIIWKAGWRATRSIPAAWFAWAAIAASVTFMLQSVTIFPDGPAMLAVAASVLEGELCDAAARLFGDDLQALDDARDDLVLDAGVEPLGVLPHHDQVLITERRLHGRQALHRTEAGIEVQTLAQLDVGAGEAGADGRGQRSLERHAIPPDGVEDVVRKLRAVLLDGGGAGLVLVPLDGDPGGLQHTAGGAGDLRADPVSGDESDGVHGFVVRIA